MHFLNAKEINISLKLYQNKARRQISKFREIGQSQENFILPVLSSVSYELCFRRLVLFGTNSFEKIFKAVAQKFEIQCKFGRRKGTVIDMLLKGLHHIYQ